MRRWAWLVLGIAFALAAVALFVTQMGGDRPPADAVTAAEATGPGPSSAELEAPTAPTLSGAPHASRREEDTPPAAPASAVPERVFTGIVVDPDGQPVPGARVQAWSDRDEPPAIAGSDGSFRLVRRQRSGWVVVRAWAPGLVATDARVPVYLGRDARVVLVPGRPVRVRVSREEDDRPVPDARVLTLCGDLATTGTQIRRKAQYTDRAITDADGAAVVLAPEGQTRILVFAQGFAPAETDPVYVPVEGVSIEVPLRRGGSVEVRVTDPEERPVVGAEVHIVCGGLVDARARTDPAGSVRFDDQPGSGTDSMIVSIRSPLWAPKAVTIEPPEPGAVRPVALRVEAGRTLSGTVRFSDDVPVPGARITAEPTDGSWFFSEHLEGAPHRAVTDAEGRFRLEHVAPGGLVVKASAPSSGVAVHREVDVPAEGAVPEVDLVADRASGGVRVVVRVVDAEGRPVAGARVEAWVLDVEDPDDDGFLSVGIADSSGRVRFRGVPPRALRFMALSDVLPYTPFEVDLSARVPPEVELRMAGGVMEGTIRFADGSPARAELRLRFLPENERGWRSGWPRVTTDAEGRFRFQGLDDGIFSIDLDTKGLRLAGGPRTFRAGERCEWTVAEDDGAPLPCSLEILDETDSTPIEGDVAVQIDGDWVEYLPVEERPGVYTSEELVDPGSYPVRVRSVGFLDVLIPEVELGGTAPTRITIRREEGAVLEGRLLAENGQPIPIAEVAAGRQRRHTDQDGRFRLGGLPDGQVEVEIHGSFVSPSKRTVTVDRKAPTRVAWRFPAAGAIALLVPIPAIPAGPVEVRVRARRDAGAPERSEMPYVGPWLAKLTPWTKGEPWVPAHFMGPLEPGVWTIEVQWGEKTLPAVEITVRGLETTPVRITPP